MSVCLPARCDLSSCSATYLVDGGQLGHLGPVQHSEGQANHLQVLAAGGCGDVPRLGAHIVDDRLLKPGNEEVGALVDDALADTTQTVEDDGAVAAFDIVERGLGETDTGCERDGEAVDGVEDVGGHVGGVNVCWYLVICWRAVVGPASRGVSINDACCLALITSPPRWRWRCGKPRNVPAFEREKDIHRPRAALYSTTTSRIRLSSPLRSLTYQHISHKMRPSQILMGGGGKPGS